MSCFVTFLGLLLDKQQHFCEAMCDHMQVHVYILLFAKHGKHKLTHKYASYTLQGSFNKSHC